MAEDGDFKSRVATRRNFVKPLGHSMASIVVVLVLMAVFLF